MPVSSVRKELKLKLPEYELVEDCLAGEQQVKFRRTKYLPKPNPEDDSVENASRYEGYLTRAKFYNVAGRTQVGMRGQIFMRDPLVEVPAQLEDVVEDATGTGVSLQQIAQQGCDLVLGFGRCGIFCDYPNMVDAEGNPTVASRAEVESGEIRPIIRVIKPKDGINWRTVGRGAKKMLVMVVFREDYDVEDDGFEVKVGDQWRVLRLDAAGEYIIELYRDKNGAQPLAVFKPTDASGKPFRSIPFWFVGSVNNEPSVDPSPMYPICSLNMGHYVNSAEYEDSVYNVGQPTYWFSGLTESWVKEVLGGKVMVGSRGGIALPADGAAGILQPEPNTMAKEAMEHKEAQMIALGAKLLEASQTERTATEASYDNVSEMSVLGTIAKNVATAIKNALQVAAQYVGVNGENIAYELNTEFDLTKLTPEERKTLIAEYNGGLLTWTEVRDSLRRAGVASLKDKEAKAEIETEEQTRMENAAKEAEALAKAAAAAEPALPGAE